jgi:hypothetical protein
MALFPPSTNSDYHGAPISAWFLAMSSVTTIVPGLIHYFLPDGGADLSTRADTIIALFAWYGALQIPFGILILIIALRYRSLVPLVLLLTILMQALGAYSGWFGKGSHSGHHPPEHYGSAAFVVLGTLFFMLSLRDRRAQQEPTT